MKKAASIFLRAEIYPNDLEQLIRWMENPNVTRYLNEDSQVIDSLRRLRDTTPSTMLTYHFNQTGRFFLVCRSNGACIGFIKLRETIKQGHYEIVYAIGEESIWGHGYGQASIRAALSMVFFEWRAKQVTAKIYAENQRSVRSVRACGFTTDSPNGQLLHYSITMNTYLRQLNT